MKRNRLVIAALGMLLCLAGCAGTPEKMSQESESVISNITHTSDEEKRTDESVFPEFIPTAETENANPDSSEEADTEEEITSTTADNTQSISGSSDSLIEIDSSAYYFDMNVCRFVADKDGNIIEPENDNEPPLKYVYDMADSKYIGTGELLGTRPDAKLYLMKDGNILSVFPCDIEPYSDSEEMLAKYSRDMIFEACCFLKFDD